ncbi:MAG: DUF3119 family protein [Merismopedia sp. SIO2A8]|nr:DUF3119 family protein [Merismopedia sp. SIO2A8]
MGNVAVTHSSPTLPDSTPSPTVELKPSYAVALGVVVLAFPIALLQPIASVPIALFGLFLLLQTVSLRLVFTDKDLDVYRGEALIRRFPYQDWENWQIFWEPVPILFYFKEVKSIHFLPMLFSAKMLKDALTQHQLPQR